MNDGTTKASGAAASPHLFTIRDVAAAWGVSVGSVRRWVVTGRVHGVKTPGRGGWRFGLDALPGGYRQ
jgi:hypothetical protein